MPDFTQEVRLKRGEDMIFQWTDDRPDDPYLYGFVSFVDSLGMLQFCIGPNTGQLVIPPEVVETLPDSGFIQMGLFSHRPVRAPADSPLAGRRIDLLGVACQESRFFVEP